MDHELIKITQNLFTPINDTDMKFNDAALIDLYTQNKHVKINTTYMVCKIRQVACFISYCTYFGKDLLILLIPGILLCVSCTINELKIFYQNMNLTKIAI